MNENKDNIVKYKDVTILDWWGNLSGGLKYKTYLEFCDKIFKYADLLFRLGNYQNNTIVVVLIGLKLSKKMLNF